VTNEILPFLWTIVASFVLAGALAAAGAHIASRQRTLQVLCLAQGAEIGALGSILLVHKLNHFLNRSETWLGLGGSFLGALLLGAIASRISEKQGSSRTPRLLGFWIALIAATHLSVAMHPALESHLARVFLGDLSTLSNPEALTILSAGAIALFILLFCHSTISQRTFDIAALGKKDAEKNFALFLTFNIIPFLVLPAVSTWGAGFLFTCSLLFLPTTMLAKSGDTAKKHVYLCTSAGAITAPIGLLISLRGEQVPTVPAIVVLLVIVCGCIWFLRGVLKFPLKLIN
jgi:ABC-type Mn2+/Zn2+ transport system permease subunit